MKIENEPAELEAVNEFKDDKLSSGDNLRIKCTIQHEMMIDANVTSNTDFQVNIESEILQTHEQSGLEADYENIENREDDDDKFFIHQFIDSDGKIWNDEDDSFWDNSNTTKDLPKIHPVINSELGNVNSSDPGNSPLNCQNIPYDLQYSTLKKDQAQKGDSCFYCMAPVQNFSRHIQRHHRHEKDVKKILALPAGNKLRKQLFGALRKQGNFLICKTLIKPVKTGSKYTSHLPCINCFGFYSRRNLYRHLKKCTGNKMIHTSRAPVDAQNFLIGNVPEDSDLKKKVFPRMRADEISLIAKQDIIICAYAARYLNSHKGDHCINIASRKMREMGKLLHEVQQLEPSIKNLFMALRPKYFDVLVEAMKNLTKYELENGNSFSPSIASNVGNALKQCCEEALSFRCKTENQNEMILEEENIDQIKMLMVLLEKQWIQAVSNLIDRDLYVNKLKNITLTLLAENVSKMTDYLIEAANIAITTLETDNKGVYVYLTLLETVFCRLVLLNRRSFEEIQTLPTELYKSTLNFSREKQEEVDQLLAKPEKLMMYNFKRIFIPGKEGKVPVLFSDDIQKHINILLKYRENIVQKSNPYLFGNPQTSQPIAGHKVFRKYAVCAGIQSTTFFTCTKLKKYIATLSQLFTMNGSNIEQLASFLGLILGVHISSYKLEDEFNQTTRVSKLLVLMEENRILDIWGKKLEDIIDLNEDLLSTEIDETITPLYKTDGFNENKQGSNNRSQSIKAIQCENGKAKRRIKIRWSSNQKEAVESYFSQHINEKRPPRKKDCIRLKALYPELLANKDWLKIKVYVQNIYTKKINFN